MIQLLEIELFLQNKSLFRSLTLQLEPGVSYLLEGNNGSGKTSLLKLLAGKIIPRSGEVKYGFINTELDWEDKYLLRKKFVHFVPAQALHELMRTPDFFYQQRYYDIEHVPLPTVRDYLGERLHKFTALHFPSTLQLNTLLDLPLSRLSNGQLKKLIILHQLLDTIPKVLLLDYPYEGLDSESRHELKEFLEHISNTYQVQLIIADNLHAMLPETITKIIRLNLGQATVQNLENVTIPSATPVLNVREKLPATKESVVELQNVTIQYGEKVIINNLNWKVNKGERWALTGRNGSGKTTLFSLIYADHPLAYSEKVYLFGKRRGTGESIWQIKKRISYLGPEQIHFIDYHTEQLTVNKFLKTTGVSERQLNELINYFNYDYALSQKLGTLSHGELQLTFLLTLFLSQKELLLLDEPFQFLDSAQKEKVTQYLNEHLNEDTTLILITHYEEDVARWTHHRLKLQ